DAVGGVINFIMRKHFNGFEVKAQGGTAADYHTIGVDMTAGKDWGSGSALISYSYLDHNWIVGKDRSYVNQGEVSPITRTCSDPTVSETVSGAVTTFALPGLVPGTANSCDDTRNLDVWPEELRHSLYGS